MSNFHWYWWNGGRRYFSRFLGFAVQLSGGGTYIAFALAGIIALITSYSYAKLSVKYPSQGGTVEFLDQAFGPGLLTGGLNVLLFFKLYCNAFPVCFCIWQLLIKFFPSGFAIFVETYWHNRNYYSNDRIKHFRS